MKRDTSHCGMQGDVFDPSTWRDQLQGATGVISTLGGFGSNAWMYKVHHCCGCCVCCALRGWQPDSVAMKTERNVDVRPAKRLLTTVYVQAVFSCTVRSLAAQRSTSQCLGKRPFLLMLRSN